MASHHYTYLSNNTGWILNIINYREKFRLFHKISSFCKYTSRKALNIINPYLMLCICKRIM